MERKKPLLLNTLFSAIGMLGLFLIVLAVLGVIALVWWCSGMANSYFLPAKAVLDPEYELETLDHTGDVHFLEFSPDGMYLAAAAYPAPDWRKNRPIGADVKIWEVATREEVGRFSFDEWVTAMSFSPDGK